MGFVNQEKSYMVDILSKFEEIYIEDIKNALIENDVDPEFIDQVLNDIKENYVRDIAEKAILQEIGPININTIKNLARNVNLNSLKNVAQNVTRNASNLYKSQAGNLRNVAQNATNMLKTASGKLQGSLRVAGISLGLATAAYLLYKATKRRFDQCAKACRKDKTCIYRCKINYQRGVITALRRNESELRRNKKLTPEKSKSINNAIKKSQAKIKEYQLELNNLRNAK